MNDDYVSQAKQNAKLTLSEQKQKTSNQIEENKTRTSQLEGQNGELGGKLASFNKLEKPNQEQKDQFEKDSQDLKSNISEIQKNQQELPKLEQKLKTLEQQEFKSLAAEAHGNDATKQAQTKAQVLEAGEGTGEMTSTNASVAGIQKESHVGRQRGRVLSKDQDRIAALADRDKIPSQDKQPNSPITQQAKDHYQTQGNESKPKEQQRYRATKEVENANDNDKQPNSEHTQGAKNEAQRVRFMSKEQRAAQEPKQQANDNQQDQER